MDLDLHGSGDDLPNTKRPYQSLRKADLAPYDVVIHLAAHSCVALCLADPEGAVRNNLTGFAELLRLCAGKRLLYASSASVYNGSGEQHATEASRPVCRWNTRKGAVRR